MAEESVIARAVRRLAQTVREAGADHDRFTEEAADHLACAAEAAQARGATADEAERAAIARFGEPALIAAAFTKGEAMRTTEIGSVVGLLASLTLLGAHVVGDHAVPSLVVGSLSAMAAAAAVGIALAGRWAILLGAVLGSAMGVAAWVTSTACGDVVGSCPSSVASRFFLGTRWGNWVLVGVPLVIAALARLVRARGAIGYGPVVAGSVALAVIGSEQAWVTSPGEALTCPSC